MAITECDQLTWTYLGQGGYNTTYKSFDGQYVLKIQRSKLNPNNMIADRPQRSVKIWNEINPDLPAFIATTKLGNGWICPYIKGSDPSDEEISGSVIDIFNRTGRIVTDASGTRNFRKTAEGKIICIDIGFALELAPENKQSLARLKRYKSIDSLDAWENVKDFYSPFFETSSHTYPLTVKTVKALLIIEKIKPDIDNVNFLNPSLIDYFATAYDRKDTLGATATLDQTLSPASVKDRAKTNTYSFFNKVEALSTAVFNSLSPI